MHRLDAQVSGETPMFRGVVILVAAFFLLALILFRPSGSEQIALIIGNADEVNAAETQSTSNNVNDIARALRLSGYEVIQGWNLNYKQLQRRIQRFAKRIDSAESALFYFTGQLVQERNRNYLIPANAKLGSLADAEFQWVRLDPLLRHMQLQAKQAVILLDACRSMHHRQNKTSPGRILVVSPCPALVPIHAGKKLRIAYASRPRVYKFEKRTRASPFTQALLDQLAQSNTSIAEAILLASTAAKRFVPEKRRPRKLSATARDAAITPNIVASPAPASLNAATGKQLTAPSRPAPKAENKTPNIMSRKIRTRLQETLAQMGCFRHTVDGVWDTASRQALARFIRATHSTPPTKMPEPRLLQYISNFSGSICATKCGPNAKAGTDHDCASGSRKNGVAGSTVRLRTRVLDPSNRANRRSASNWHRKAFGARRRISSPYQNRSLNVERIGVRVWGIRRAHNSTIGRKLGYQRRITFDVDGGSVSYTRRIRVAPGP